MSSVEQWLIHNAIPYTFLHYPPAISDPVEAGKFLGMATDQMIKSLVIKAGDQFVMVLVPLTKRLDLLQLAGTLQVKKCRMATPEEAFAVTGYRVGTISPFLLASPIPIYLDETLLQKAQVVISSGEQGKELILHPADVHMFTKSTLLVL